MNAIFVLLALLAPADKSQPPFPQGAKLGEALGRGGVHRGGGLAGGRRRSCSPTSATGSCGSTRRRQDVTVFREPSGRANGLIFDPKGRLIVAEGANTGGGRRVSITERDGTVRTLADRYQGKRFNSPNDVAVDAQGRVYVSDPRYVGDEPRELDFEAVFRIDPDGTRHPPRDHGRRSPTAWRSAPTARPSTSPTTARPAAPCWRSTSTTDGDVSNPRVLHDFGNGRGIDGMTVTTDGRIVAAAGAGDKAGVYVFAPDGKPLGVHPHPRAPHQRRVRRPRPQDPLHHRRQEPLPDQDHHDRLSRVPRINS